MKNKVISIPEEPTHIVFNKQSIGIPDDQYTDNINKIKSFINEQLWVKALDEIKYLLNDLITIAHQDIPQIKDIARIIEEYTIANESNKRINTQLNNIDKLLSNNKHKIAQNLKPLVNHFERQLNIWKSYHARTTAGISTNVSIHFANNVMDNEQTVLNDILKRKEVYDDVFRNIFRRSDISIDNMRIINASYFSEGGFKRVYRISCILDTGYHFTFLVKVVKKDVAFSDTGHKYDIEYASKYIEIAHQAREIDLFLHLPIGGLYQAKDNDKQQRIVYTEALLPSIASEPAKEIKGRITVAAYLRYWTAFNEKIFFDDPNNRNVVIQVIGDKYKCTVIDLDNIDFDKTFYPYSFSEPFILNGFSYADLAMGIVDALDKNKAMDFAQSIKHVLDILGDKKHATDFWEYFLVTKEEGPYEARPKKSDNKVNIIVNGIDAKISEDTTLLELLQDSYVDINETIIKINGKPIDISNPNNREYILSSYLAHGDEISFHHRYTELIT
ncbi:MAG: hypothetical protein DKM50_08370 [Candidatus Margulisiibacteriota bacterium]|nr:MAG: hypothetical protein A2X43_03150 [Candidatus Margulisbacteria bacterium GWD2_39_127]OGI05010.1 MAG: hypothetical protein A2X42_05415 [Candidatus Margulisbacteria bacterium GWF2_38_17]OGI09006.1 MAG: hypothetical protein A2X41_01610 [Candidatus Margulisbacteria bacterium GWE2_39_32]PZM79610.1 MAG: hypothetical protein DKM50_08370 [Candidatus Margulisiibacteriota bacterium]HAR63208.1 hypothetical protein [Candidatus Margulisiibacteriota bacterium]